MSPPALAIGMPVFNGERFLPAALASLLGQELGDFELVISDNASTDGTREICEDVARRDRRVRYTRNERNLGVMANFLRVPQLATAPLFMWAAHDDTWSPDYTARLVRLLAMGETAVLAAGRTEYVTVDGEPDPFPANHAPPPEVRPTSELVAQLLREHATSWFYGIYRRAALPGLLARLQTFPVWGGDVLFLLHCCLEHDVVGDEAAIIYKRLHRKSAYAPSTPRQRTTWQLSFSAGMARVVAGAAIPWAQKWAIRDELVGYVRRRVFSKSLRGTAKQWARAAIAVGRGQE